VYAYDPDFGACFYWYHQFDYAFYGTASGSAQPTGSAAIQQNGTTVGTVAIGSATSNYTFTTPPVGVTGNINFVAQFSPSSSAFTSATSTTLVVFSSNWGVATLLANGAEPQIASDANGNAIAVWGGVGTDRYAAGSGWGTPTLFQADGGYEPHIASNASGNAVVVWYNNDMTVWANLYAPGSGWGTPTSIPISPEGGFWPQVAIDATGNIIAVWLGQRVWANRYTPGTGWGTATSIHTGSSGERPQIAMSPNGNAIAVWSANEGLWANRYTLASGWGTAELIPGNGSSRSPQIAIDGSGNAIVVWQQFDNTRYSYSVGTNRYTAGSGWGAATVFETSSGVPPAIAMDANGNAIAVWQGSGGIRTNRYTAGSGWGAATLISTGGGSPQIAMDANGNGIAVWSQYDGTRHNIWANRYTAASGWGAAELIEINNVGDVRDPPQITIDGMGNAIAVWSRYDGTTYNIWANRFTP